MATTIIVVIIYGYQSSVFICMASIIATVRSIPLSIYERSICQGYTF